MVFDKPRLPGVQVRREGLAYRNTDAGEEAPGDARHLGLNPCTSRPHHREGNSQCATRGLEHSLKAVAIQTPAAAPNF